MPRRYSRTAAEVSAGRIDEATRRERRPVDSEFRRDALLSRPRRTVVLPEPVVPPAMVNGRELASWEAGLYVEAMHRERRRELAMFEGLIG